MAWSKVTYFQSWISHYRIKSLYCLQQHLMCIESITETYHAFSVGVSFTRNSSHIYMNEIHILAKKKSSTFPATMQPTKKRGSFNYRYSSLSPNFRTFELSNLLARRDSITDALIPSTLSFDGADAAMSASSSTFAVTN